MEQILLDSNIVIYLLREESWIIQWLQSIGDKTYSISIISWIEVLAGGFKHLKTMEEIKNSLDKFQILPLDRTVGDSAAVLSENSYRIHGRKINFQDSLIAATALAYDMPLITNNPKDFRTFKGLKVISPKRVK